MFAPARELKCRNTRVVSHVTVTPYVVNKTQEKMYKEVHIYSLNYLHLTNTKIMTNGKKAEVFCEHSVKCLCYWFLNSDNLM
jgi:hypothetical protein